MSHIDTLLEKDNTFEHMTGKNKQVWVFGGGERAVVFHGQMSWRDAWVKKANGQKY